MVQWLACLQILLIFANILALGIFSADGKFGREPKRADV